MRYGWVIADGDRILVEGQGPAPGDSELLSSFRTEGYGMLTAIRFIYRIHQYLDMKPELHFHLHSDNQGLIKRIIRNRDATVPKMSEYLSADVDVTLTILKSLELLPRASISHVKGHQDDHTPFHKLSDPAKLNVRADELATAQLKEMKKPEECVPLLPGASLMLHI